MFFLLGAVIVAAYRPSLRAPFVFDSVNNIAENPAIRMARVDPPSLRRAAFPEKLPLRPLAYLSFALNYRIGGLDPFGFRLVNLLILLASLPAACWLALVASKALAPGSSAGATALGATALWSLHPILTNGVTYAVQRMTSLSTLFSLLALGAFFSGALRARRGRWFAAAAVLWALAFATKETALIVPFLALLFLWQVAPEGGPGRRRLAFALLAAVATSQIVLALFSAQTVRLGWVPPLSHTLVQRVLTEGRVVVKYLSLFLLPLPSRLNLDHSFALSASWFSPPSTIGAFAFHALLVGAALGLRRRRPLLCFSLLSFYLLQLAEGTFLPLDVIFEHRLYFPSFFLALAATDLLSGALGALAPRRRELAFAAAVTLAGACLVFVTHQRNVLWSDPVALWRDVVAKSPTNPRAHINLGAVLAQRGRHGEALEVYRRVLAMAPDSQPGRLGEANALNSLGLHRDAIASYRQAIALEPDCPKCHNNLGNAYFALGMFADAQRSYARALELDPDHVMALFNLGLASVRLGRREAALAVQAALAGRSPELAGKLLAEIR